MSVFRNIRIYPSHGSRSAVLTWELDYGVEDGEVYVAFSLTGIPDTWEVRTETVGLSPTPIVIPSEIGMFHDTSMVMEMTALTGYYQLALVNSDGTFKSERVGIIGDLTAAEHALVRGILHQEFTQMRATQGYPVWHCIPKSSGEPSDHVDPDTGEIVGIECPGDESPSYGLPFEGGYNAPILTWMRATEVMRGTLKDPEDGFSSREDDRTAVRLMAYPTPSCEHMIVDPATDRRYLVGEEIKPYLFRGIMPIAYETVLTAISLDDERYRFPVPFVDTKAYRRIAYWTPDKRLPFP